ncbi:MAG: PHP domain-containing protein [Gemmatimonadota bacterium]
MRIDLHLHSTASDGELPPGELVLRAGTAGLGLVALTDHDSAAGVEEARAAGTEVGVTVVPATELSSTWDGRDVHVLGYGIDPGAPSSVDRGRRARLRRRERMRSMVERLQRQGVTVTLEAVERSAGEGLAMIGRPHLARALVESGRVSSVEEAFDTLIGDDHPAFVPTDLGSPTDAVRAIVDAGGIPVWAHPPRDLLPKLLPGLRDAGMMGLEVYRASWSARRSRGVLQVAVDAGMCVTAGSDWHGPTKGGSLGEFWVGPQRIRQFLDLLGERMELPLEGH